MWKASALEFRFRYYLHAAMITLGFWAPWSYLDHGGAGKLTAANTHVWGLLAANLAPLVGARGNPLNIVTAFNILLALAIAFALAAAALRTWGTAYLGATIVESGAIQAGGGVVQDGPYRHLRNPLYLGTIFHVVALALLMSRVGAVFTIVAITLLQVRLILGEEAFLTARLGEPYVAYCAKVPRIMPVLKARLPVGGRRARWLQGFLAEIYFWGVAISFAVFGWAYVTPRLIQAVIISFGVALLVRAVMPKDVGAVSENGSRSLRDDKEIS